MMPLPDVRSCSLVNFFTMFRDKASSLPSLNRVDSLQSFPHLPGLQRMSSITHGSWHRTLQVPSIPLVYSEEKEGVSAISG